MIPLFSSQVYQRLFDVMSKSGCCRYGALSCFAYFVMGVELPIYEDSNIAIATDFKTGKIN